MTAHPDLTPTCAGDLAFRSPGTSAWEQAALARANIPATDENPDPARSWELGAEGEEQAAALFAALGPGWYALHDITVSHTGTNVDHILIGPPGVFVVNTKNRKNGTVLVTDDGVVVNGEPTDYLDKALYERDVVIDRLADMVPVLPFPICSLLLFVNAREVSFHGAPSTSFVCTEDTFASRVRAMNPTYTPEQTWALFNQMRNPNAWLPAPAAAHDPVQDFFETVFTDLFRAVGNLLKRTPQPQPPPTTGTPTLGAAPRSGHPILLGCGIFALAALLGVVSLVWLLMQITGFNSGL